jgi:hypothetical protein
MDSNLPRDLPGEVESLGDNQETIPMLIAQLQCALRVIPFVGAGLSRPFCFPSWREFLLNQANKAYTEEKDKEKIQQQLDSGGYEKAAEALLNARRHLRFHDDIDTTFGEDKIRDEQFRGEAVSVLPDLAPGPVITTNFDRVLEKAFEQANRPFERVVLGARPDPAIRAFHENRRFLLKIHGDVEDRQDRILTEGDYNEHYGSADGSIDSSPPLPRLLYLLFAARPLLFIGCSLNQDRSVTVLKRVQDDYPSISHYAIVMHPESEEQFNERSRFLSDHTIRPIWYPHGQHEYIEPLLKYLVNQTQGAEQHMVLDVREPGLEIYLTGPEVGWNKNPRLRYQESSDGYLLTGFRDNEVGSQFKHFVVCKDEEKTRIRDILSESNYTVTGHGKEDDEPGKWQFWFLVQDYPILSDNLRDNIRDNNVWWGVGRSNGR